MSKRQIKVEQIKSIQVNLNNYDGVGSYDFQASSAVNDDSTALLESALQTMAKSNNELPTTIENLNNFLDKVADAFQARNNQLKDMIDGSLREVPIGTKSQRNEKFISEGKDSAEKHARRKQVEFSESLQNEFP